MPRFARFASPHFARERIGFPLGAPQRSPRQVLSLHFPRIGSSLSWLRCGTKATIYFVYSLLGRFLKPEPMPFGSPLHFFWSSVERPSLTDSLSENLMAYVEQFAGKRSCDIFDLSQSAVRQPRVVNKDGSLMTITCGSSWLFSRDFGRPLTGQELLAAQGLPSCGMLAARWGLAKLPVHKLSNSQQVRLAGNAMHLGCLTAALASCLFSVSFQDPPLRQPLTASGDLGSSVYLLGRLCAAKRELARLACRFDVDRHNLRDLFFFPFLPLS